MQISRTGSVGAWQPVIQPPRQRTADGTGEAPAGERALALGAGVASVAGRVSPADRTALANRLRDGLSASGAVTSVQKVSEDMDIDTDHSAEATMTAARGRPVLDTYA
jgi:hypothetical protein